MNCLATVGLDSFFGTCRKCANGGDVGFVYDEFEDADSEPSRYLAYALQDTDDTGEDPDSLLTFLPYSDDF
jgi:hypothetical protein